MSASPRFGNSDSRDDDDQLVNSLRDSGLHHICPDCGASISTSRGVQPLTTLQITLGWACQDCRNVVPLRLEKEYTPGIDELDGFVETLAQLRDGSIVRIPTREVRP